MRLKKRRKSSRYHGSRTCGHSAKLNKGKGSHGGKGMSGTGKRADQKKTLVIKLYGQHYFGRSGMTSKKTERKRVCYINVEGIQEKYAPGEIKLTEYKILGSGEIKGKYTIHAKAATKSAIEKIKKAGGEIILKSSDKKTVEKSAVKNKDAKKDNKS
jgi:ribosomal protein L15